MGVSRPRPSPPSRHIRILDAVDQGGGRRRAYRRPGFPINIKALFGTLDFF